MEYYSSVRRFQGPIRHHGSIGDDVSLNRASQLRKHMRHENERANSTAL
jgi:hypothetical protein